MSRNNTPAKPRNSSAHLILQHSTIYLAARFLGAGLQLGLLVVLTHKLSPDAYGRLALFSSAFSFAAILIFNPWRQTLTRFWPEQGETVRVFQARLVVGVLISTFLLLCILLLIYVTDAVPGFYLAALAAAVIAGGWTEINLEMHRRRLKPVSYLKLFVTRSVTQFLFMGLGAILTGSATGAIAGLAASHLTAAILSPWRQWYSAFKPGKNRFQTALPDLKRWLVYALPLALSEFVAIAMVYTDRIMIAAQLGVDQAGQYSATHDLTWMGLQVISLVAYLAFFPIALKAEENQNPVARDQALSHGFTLLFGLSLASTVGLTLLATPVSALVLGEEFRAGAPKLMVLIAGVHLIYVLKVYWIDLSFSLAKRTWPLLIIGTFSVLANIVLNAVLVPIYGLGGAAVATGLASLGGLALTGAVAKIMKLANYPVCWRDVFKIIFAVFLMWLAITSLPQAKSLVWLAAGVIVGAIVFILTLWILRLSLLTGIFPWRKRTV